MLNVLYVSKSIFLAALVSILTLIATFIGHWLANAIGFVAQHPFSLTSKISLLCFFGITAIVASITGELFKKLKQPTWERIISIFGYHFFFFYVFHMLDKAMRGYEVNVVHEFISNLVATTMFALLVSYLWRPDHTHTTTSFKVHLTDYYRSYQLKKWIFRFLFGWFVFVVIYSVTNWMMAPFLVQYDPTLTVDLTNSFLVKLLLGATFILLTLPIFIRWQESKTTLLFWIGFPIFLQIALSPAVIDVSYPIDIRFLLLIQNIVLSFLVAIFYVQLFFVPEESDLIDDQFKWMY